MMAMVASMCPKIVNRFVNMPVSDEDEYHKITEIYFFLVPVP